MIDKKMANKAMRDGLCAVCAWCERWWEMTDKAGEAGGCRETACGGPSVRKAFPRYKGPMEGNLARWCFVCGVQADAAVDIGGKGMIGVCNAHVPQLKKILENSPGSVRPTIKEENVMTVGDGHRIRGNAIEA